MLVTGVCPYDGGRHQHLVRDLDNAGGARRAGCGDGAYWLVIERVYQVVPPAAEAA
jgi:hypothetical protein